MRKVFIRALAALAIAGAVFGFMSCEQASGGAGDGDAPALSDGSFNVRTQDPSWDSAALNPNELGVRFIFKYDSSIDLNRVNALVFYSPDKSVYWAYGDTNGDDVAELGNVYIDTEAREIVTKWLIITDSPKALPLGNWHIEMSMIDEKVHSLDVPVLPPGATSLGSFDSLSTESASSTVAAALSFPDITSFTKTASSVSVSFDVKDSRVRNAWIFFYDADDNQIGNTYSVMSNTDASVLRTGVSGTVWTCAGIQLADLHLEAGKSIADIARASVDTVDGKQFPGTYEYRHRTWGAIFPLD